MFLLEDFSFKRNKVVNNWALISSHCAPEIPFKVNILCVFIVLLSTYCISYVALSQILSRVVWTVMNGMYSRSSSEFLRWRIRKVSSPSLHVFFFIFFFFFFFTGGVVGLVGLPLCSF